LIEAAHLAHVEVGGAVRKGAKLRPAARRVLEPEVAELHLGPFWRNGLRKFPNNSLRIG